MPSTILGILAAAPLNSFVIALNSVIWFWHWNRRHGYEDIAISFRRVMIERQYYRAITATFSHLGILHLVFNMASLYSIGMLEAVFGTEWYFRQTVLLIFFAAAAWMALTFLLVRFGGPATARLVDSSAVGYSGVLFGWLSLQSVLMPGSTMSFIGIPVPSLLAPWAALLITHLILPQASFLGHLSGIIAGYVIGTGLMNFITGFWLYSSVLLLSLLCLLSLKANANTSRLLACVTVSPAFMAATGLGATVEEIAAASSSSAASTGGAGAPRRYIDGGILRAVNPSVTAEGSMVNDDVEMGGAGARPTAATTASSNSATAVSSSSSSSSSTTARPSVAERLRGVWSSFTSSRASQGGYARVGGTETTARASAPPPPPPPPPPHPTSSSSSSAFVATVPPPPSAPFAPGAFDDDDDDDEDDLGATRGRI